MSDLRNRNREHQPAERPTAEQVAADVITTVRPILEQLEWAEEEIARAQHRHPPFADAIYHAFRLLTPTHPRMSYELVYRAHCREILDRIAAGSDTRPGTAAEVCCACSEASLVAPLTSPAAGLYGRMWAEAFPEHPILPDRQLHHEALEASEIDDLEADARRRLTVKDRTLSDETCLGQHHGETVRCRYERRAAT